MASTENELSLELAFEHNPLEILSSGGGYTGVAAIGILAAIAVPAYQDYTVRARVQEGVGHSIAARTALGIACGFGDLDSQADNSLLGLDPPEAYGENSDVVLSVEAKGISTSVAEVTITYRAIESVVPEGAQVIYWGECSENGMSWSISSAAGMPPKFQPKS